MCCIVGCLSSMKELSQQRAEDAVRKLEQMAETGNICVFSAEVQRQVQVLEDLGHEVRYLAIS